MRIFIKNMVCNRCISAVNSVLDQLGYTVQSIRLGEVDLMPAPDAPALERIRVELERQGFELLDDHRQQLISQIKSALIQHIHQQETVNSVNLSDFLPRLLHRDYSYLSRLFSETESRTIEQYYIEQKIERAKELLVYNELTVSEIAWQLGYSSVAHLSSQFKKVTGMTPSAFREIGASRRKNLDAV